MDRHVQEFDMLKGLHISGRRQPQLINFVIVDTVGNLFIHSFRRKWLSQSPGTPFLASTFGFLAAINLLLGRFDNIAGRRFGDIAVVLHGPWLCGL